MCTAVRRSYYDSCARTVQLYDVPSTAALHVLCSCASPTSCCPSKDGTALRPSYCTVAVHLATNVQLYMPIAAALHVLCSWASPSAAVHVRNSFASLLLYSCCALTCSCTYVPIAAGLHVLCSCASPTAAVPRTEPLYVPFTVQLLCTNVKVH